MTILENAVDSIAVGLEDFESSDPRRLVSCTRNVFSGLLLLFKHKLGELSPQSSDEALLKKVILPRVDSSGEVHWTGKGRKTVDVHQIRERFESLGIDVDWRRVERIANLRNEIEHYYTTNSHDAIRSLLSTSFVVINDFVRRHLDADPRDLLGDDSWSVLIRINQVYEAEKAECDAALESLSYFHDEIRKALSEYNCEVCGSGLIRPGKGYREAIDATFECKGCGEALPYEDISKLAVTEHYSFEVYLSHTDGNEMPLADCPECDGVYIYAEEICSGCGYSAEHVCQRCSAPIPPEELECSPFCGYGTVQISVST